MKAAVLHTLGEAPRFENFPEPMPEKGEVTVHVKASSLNNLSKMRAGGSHYDSYQSLPAVCGVDGVGLLDDGARVYCGGFSPPQRVVGETAGGSSSWGLSLPHGGGGINPAALPNAPSP